MKRMNLFFLSLLITAGLLCGIVFVQTRLNSIIRDKQLLDEEFIEGAPPMLAFTTVALGGFRGLIADILWMRSFTLQEQGKYYELVQLADWIQKLQPKFSGASGFLGWNMAYNISVTCKSFDDRWRWIHKGMETYVTAIKLNPNDPELYKELGWIYQHKLGNVFDDAQQYYKVRLGNEMLNLYGTRYPDWAALAAAPKTEKGFRELYTKDSNPYFWKVWEKQGYHSIDALSEEYRKNNALPGELASSLYEEDAKILSSYLRAKWMREAYLIDPKIVYEINQKYGDLDWLLPESFAIYWAYQGNMRSPNRQDTACDRMIVQSLQTSFRNGRMLLPDNTLVTENFMLIPNVSIADSVRQAYEDGIRDNPGIRSFKSGYDVFMRNATALLYSYGKYSEARKYFNDMRKMKMASVTRFGNDLDAFVLAKWDEDLKEGGYKLQHEQINALIYRSCSLLAYGDTEAAAVHLELAKKAYDNYYQNFIAGTPDENAQAGRMKLPPFNEMTLNMVINIMKNYPGMGESLRAGLLSQPDGEKTVEQLDKRLREIEEREKDLERRVDGAPVPESLVK